MDTSVICATGLNEMRLSTAHTAAWILHTLTKVLMLNNCSKVVIATLSA